MIMTRKITEYNYLVESYRNEYRSCKWWQFLKKKKAYKNCQRALELLNNVKIEK